MRILKLKLQNLDNLLVCYSNLPPVNKLILGISNLRDSPEGCYGGLHSARNAYRCFVTDAAVYDEYHVFTMHEGVLRMLAQSIDATAPKDLVS